MKAKLNKNKAVTVFGAYGHTGKFVVAELVKRGCTPILSGRSSEKLHTLGNKYPSLEIRPSSINDPDSLDNALNGAFAVINCAGPFLDTATPVIAAALRKRVHYLDMAAEQQCVDIGIALDSWMPTAGTRLTGERNTGRRLTFSHQALVPIPDPLPTRKWQFAKPFGSQDVVAFPLTEMITLSKHLHVGEINTYINLAAMKDIHDNETPPPQAADATGRSAQIFMMEVAVRLGDKIRNARATGKDIYWITAPLIVEATVRIAEDMIKNKGVVSPGEAFDAKDFLMSMSPDELRIEYSN